MGEAYLWKEGPKAMSLIPSQGMDSGHGDRGRRGMKEEEGALNFGPREKEASWSSFYGFGKGNVLVSTGGEATIGHPQRRHAKPGPYPGKGELEGSGRLLGNVTAKILTIQGRAGAGLGWIRGSGVASHSRSCLPEMPHGWCPSVTQSHSCPLAAGCQRSSEGSPWTS